MPHIRRTLRVLASRLPDRPVTRFAPSPTGYLHLGHVVNAIYVWGVARAASGSVFLRIEDHDRVRCRPEFESALLEDLEWLGFGPLLPPVAMSSGPVRQSNRQAVYEEALERLRSRFDVYACDCSRTAIGGERYHGRCRGRQLEEGPGRGLRVRLEGGAERFDDVLLGALEQSPADQCGDLLIRDRHGQWTYQFAVTVDDARQGVTLVIRGADLVSSTGRQLRLWRMLAEAGGIGARPPATYLHHPLLLDARGEKLSKSTGAAGVRSLRARGAPAALVIGKAAAAIGLIENERPLNAEEAAALVVRR